MRSQISIELIFSLALAALVLAYAIGLAGGVPEKLGFLPSARNAGAGFVVEDAKTLGAPFSTGGLEWAENFSAGGGYYESYKRLR